MYNSDSALYNVELSSAPIFYSPNTQKSLCQRYIISVFFPFLVSPWYCSRSTHGNMEKSSSLTLVLSLQYLLQTETWWLRCSGQRGPRPREPTWGPGRSTDTCEGDPPGSSRREYVAPVGCGWEAPAWILGFENQSLINCTPPSGIVAKWPLRDLLNTGARGPIPSPLGRGLMAGTRSGCTSLREGKNCFSSSAPRLSVSSL